MAETAAAFSRAAANLLENPAAPRFWIGDRRNGLLLLALGWMMVVLMVAPESFDYTSLAMGVTPESGDAFSRTQWLVLLGGGLLVLAWRAPLALLMLGRTNVFMLLFTLLAAASLFWSIEPELTGRRLIRVVTILVVALAVTVIAWQPRRFQLLLRPVVTAILAGSIVGGLFWPHLTIHSEQSPELLDAWRGLTNHKNSLGAMAAIGLLLWFHGWVAREVHWLAALAGIAVAGACLVLSRSTTSLIAATFMLALIALMMSTSARLRRFLPYLVALFVVTLLAYSFALLRIVPGLEILLEPVMLLTGKDLSFTGRTDIWNIVVEHARGQWLAGSGYGAYWLGAVPWSPSYVMLRVLRFYPGSAHSGYLDVYNDLGVLGLACLIGFLVVYVRQALQVLAFDFSQGVLFIGLFVQQAITNLTESHWMFPLSVNFVFTTLAVTAMARAILDNRMRAYFGEPDATPLLPGGGGMSIAYEGLDGKALAGGTAAGDAAPHGSAAPHGAAALGTSGPAGQENALARPA